MFSLCDQYLLVEACHAYLAAGQQGLTDHDDEQGHDNHGHGEQPEEPAAGAVRPAGGYDPERCPARRTASGIAGDPGRGESAVCRR